MSGKRSVGMLGALTHIVYAVAHEVYDVGNTQ